MSARRRTLLVLLALSWPLLARASDSGVDAGVDAGSVDAASDAMVALPAAAPTPPAFSELDGRVFERGSINGLKEIRLEVATGETTTTDERGHFHLRVPAGAVELVIISDSHEPLRAKELLKPGQLRQVEYRLLPLKSHRRYEATVRAEARHDTFHLTLRDDELQKLPGTLGDPFRVIGTLPGVSTPIPVLPYFVVRGASPGMTGFGTGVVHGRLIDRLDFYPGSYDVSFGRYAGGIIDSETRPARKDGYHGEVELRLYDVSAYAEGALPRGVRLELSGHYGYPGFLIHAFDPNIDLEYGDFQGRLDWRGLTVEALGSYDQFSAAQDTLKAGLVKTSADLHLAFYRLQIRDRERIRNIDMEAALVGGIDEMGTLGGIGVRKLSLAARYNVRARFRRFQILAGIDGELSRFTAQNFDPGIGESSPDELGDLAGGRDGQVLGAFAQTSVDLVPSRLQATLGVRGDLYHASGTTLLGLDPRLQMRAKLLPWLEVSGGIGLYQQPPTFPVALPGIDTFGLQLGLQRSWQGSTTVEAKMPQALSFSLTGFYSKLTNANDAVLDMGASNCTAPPSDSLTGLPARLTRQVDGDAYGMELMLRRNSGRLTGWIAYTLSRSERIFGCGVRPADFDQTHVLNIVAQVRLPWQLLFGGRFFVSTGRPYTFTDTSGLFGSQPTRNNARLPDYFQLDLRLDREWVFQKWALAAFVEIVNLTYSKFYLGANIRGSSGATAIIGDDVGTKTAYNPANDGFHFILPSVGLRGRF